MFGASFYNATTRKYVAMFGTLVNDISIARSDNTATEIQRMKVPINYGPMQKFLAKVGQDKGLNSPAITLPRMSFEITTMAYDPERRLTGRYISSPAGPNAMNVSHSPTPWNLEFQLNIMTKYQEDGSKILEQILPYFKPEFTVSARLIDGSPDIFDIPIVLNSVSSEDTYEGNFEDRRALIWTLTFTLKGYFFGPTVTRKLIKFVEANIYSKMPDTAINPDRVVTVQPGLTANGEPTTNINDSIAWQDINIDDDWAYIVRVEDYVE